MFTSFVGFDSVAVFSQSALFAADTVWLFTALVGRSGL